MDRLNGQVSAQEREVVRSRHSVDFVGAVGAAGEITHDAVLRCAGPVLRHEPPGFADYRAVTHHEADLAVDSGRFRPFGQLPRLPDVGAGRLFRIERDSAFDAERAGLEVQLRRPHDDHRLRPFAPDHFPVVGVGVCRAVSAAVRFRLLRVE